MRVAAREAVLRQRLLRRGPSAEDVFWVEAPKEAVKRSPTSFSHPHLSEAPG
jgi:hypothetical protein